MFDKFKKNNYNYFKILSGKLQNGIKCNKFIQPFAPVIYGKSLFQNEEFKNNQPEFEHLWNANEINLPLVYEALYYIHTGLSNNVNIYSLYI